MSVRFNTEGTQLLALRRRLPPILFNTPELEPICQFYHTDYYNSCTMKSCSFAGVDDEYVVSGSDDFNVYMWRISDANRKQSLSAVLAAPQCARRPSANRMRSILQRSDGTS